MKTASHCPVEMMYSLILNLLKSDKNKIHNIKMISGNSKSLLSVSSNKTVFVNSFQFNFFFFNCYKNSQIFLIIHKVMYHKSSVIPCYLVSFSHFTNDFFSCWVDGLESLPTNSINKLVIDENLGKKITEV